MKRCGSWRVVVGVGCLAGIVGANVAPATAEPFAIDSVHSTVLFRIKHMGTSNAWGRFNHVSGTVDLDAARPNIDVEIKTDSIDTASQKRDQHLKSPDFFNAKQFPSISFKSTHIKPGADGTYEVEGTLSLHGVAKPVSVQLVRVGAGKNPMGGSIVGYETVFDVKRSDYGMKYLLEGLGDEVKLIVSLECGKQ